ncbi:MAG: NADH:flavin oxidoreductase [Planctomycetota bacterium]
MAAFPKVATLRTTDDFRSRLAELGVSIPIDDELSAGEAGALGETIPAEATGGAGPIGNRWCVLPMEGWDGDESGAPSELTERRWRRFGDGGAKLIWGGEAVAVRHDGRANPNQLTLTAENAAAIGGLRETLVGAHRARFGSDDGLCVGLQLTHSGRYARPNPGGATEPRIAYRHPVLDRRVGVAGDEPILSDEELDRLVDDFVAAAVRARDLGFAFVDVKHCHGYLGHELLSGYDRPGRYGGDFEGRTRFLRNVVAGIRAEAPGLAVGVRVSVFDFSPFRPNEATRVGEPEATDPYGLAFGGDGTGLGIDLSEPGRLLDLLEGLGVRLVCTTAGSPYYNPHIQRPAAFPPSDGYLPPEDPLVGVARQIDATARLKTGHPGLVIVGSGYSYLQDWLPNVGQAVVSAGMADSVGLGRMILSYPDLPADALAGHAPARKKVCRTFSDCTTAPRNGMVSGCYPLDAFYKSRPERGRLADLAKAASE